MTTNKNVDVVHHSDEKQHQLSKDEYFDYSPRGPWLRAAVLGANDGLTHVAILMMGLDAVKDVICKFLLGLAILVAGAISIAVQEYVSVYSQLDLELAQTKRDRRMGRNQDERQLSNPLRVAIAASVAYLLGGVTPLLVGSFILDHDLRLGVLVATVSVTLVVFGRIWSVVGGTPAFKSCFRVLLGGLIVLAITFGQATLLAQGKPKL